MRKRPTRSDFSRLIQPVDPKAPDPSVIRGAAEQIRNGGLAVFPTWGLYGIGADIFQPDAVARVFQAKKRPPGQPIAILIPSQTRLNPYVTGISESARKLMEAFWPGGITLVFRASALVPELLTARTGKIGIRVPLHPVAAALVESLAHPITATSANLSGEPGCADVAVLSPEVMAEMAVILDAGLLFGGAGSTVVDVTTHPPAILRQGSVPAADIRQCLGLEPG
ncbi:MAG: L-threonylcarbamoyladenylate synthase [Thermodesulfobacteriota bacterium]